MLLPVPLKTRGAAGGAGTQGKPHTGQDRTGQEAARREPRPEVFTRISTGKAKQGRIDSSGLAT